MSRCDSAAMVPKTSDDLPDPETPVNTVTRRLGISTLTSLRLFCRAPWTRMRSWLSAWCCFDCGEVGMAPTLLGRAAGWLLRKCCGALSAAGPGGTLLCPPRRVD